MNQTNAKTWHWTGIGGLPKQFPCAMLPVAATSLHSFSSVPLVIRRGAAKKQTVHCYMSEGSKEDTLFCELSVTDFFAVDLELV